MSESGPQAPVVISDNSRVKLGLVVGLVAAVAIGAASAAWALRGAYDRLDALERELHQVRRGCAAAEAVTEQAIASAIRRLSAPADFTRDGKPRVAAVRRALGELGLELRPTRLEIDAVWRRMPRAARPRPPPRDLS